MSPIPLRSTAVIAALFDEGPRPDVHREAVRKLAREWPALWAAILRDGDEAERARLRRMVS